MMKNIKLLSVLLVLPFVLNAQDFGTSTHRMNRFSHSAAVLEFWGKNTKDELKLYELAYNTFQKSANANYADLLNNVAYNRMIDQMNVVLLGGPMLGDVTSNRISVWFRTARPGIVEVEVSSEKMNKKFDPVKTSVQTDLAGIVTLDGLKPGTKYTYKLIVNGQKQQEIHQFKTAPPEYEKGETRIAFGSCSHRWGLGNEKLWRTIKKRQPVAMLALGDIAVQDRTNHLGLHRADYLMRDFHVAWSDFVAEIPVYATWDDHDYFANDKAGVPEGYTVKDKENVWEVFRRSWVNPYYGFGEAGKGVFLNTTIGVCDVIMTDNRYFCTGEKGSFLGDGQMEWLKKQLLESKSPFKIVSCGSMWSDYVSKGKDSWGKKDPSGRVEIFKFIEDHNIKGVLFISGDRHGAHGFTIPRPTGMKFYEFEAASLGARVGGKPDKEGKVQQLYSTMGVFAYGEFSFNTNEKDPFVVYRLIKEDGEILYEVKINQSQLTPDNYNN